MLKSIKSIKKFLNDISGATAIEYALIAALIGIVIIAGLTTLGGEINKKFDRITDALKTNTAPSS